MALRISTAARNAMVSAVTALADAGSGAAHVRIYTGTQPATPATTASGTLLLDIPLNDPSFAAPSTGVATGDVTPEPTDDGITTGTAGWFRLLDSNDVAILDGAVTGTGGGGECTLSTTSITTGLTVNLTSITLTQPAS